MPVILIALLLLVTGVAARESTDLLPAVMLEEAKRVQIEDFGSWPQFRFRRQVHREVLDADGNTDDSELLDFQIVPIETGVGEFHGFDEKLLQVDDRTPTPREIERYRERGSFAKHYRKLVAGTGQEREEAGYSLAHLLRMTNYRYLGVEVLDGISCHRLDFSPAPEGQEDGIAGLFAESMSGSIWLTVNGLHLYKARASTMKPISIALSLFKIHEFKVEMQSGPVNEQIWLPRRIQTEIRIRIIAKTIRRKTLYNYFDFVPRDRPGEGSLFQAVHDSPGGA